MLTFSGFFFARFLRFGVYCREKIPKDTKRNERASVENHAARSLLLLVGYVFIRGIHLDGAPGSAQVQRFLYQAVQRYRHEIRSFPGGS